MNCKKCGNVLAPTDTVCRVCGEPVAVETPVAPALAPAAPAPIPTAPAVEPAPVMPASVPTAPVEPVPMAAPNPEPVAPMPAPTQPMVDESNMPRMASAAPVEPVPVIPTPGIQADPNTPVMPVNNQMPVGVVANNQPQELPAEETPAKKKSSPIVVVLLLVVLIAVIAFIVIYLKKQLSPSTPETNTDTPVVDTTPTAIGVAWMDYIVDQDITNISLERVPLTGEKETAILTKDELRDIFTKLSSYALIKRYYEGAGVADGDILTIVYTKDGSEYEVKLANGIIWADSTSLKDEELRNSLESADYTVEREELKDKEGAFYNYVFSNYESTIFDEYFSA